MGSLGSPGLPGGRLALARASTRPRTRLLQRPPRLEAREPTRRLCRSTRCQVRPPCPSPVHRATYPDPVPDPRSRQLFSSQLSPTSSSSSSSSSPSSDTNIYQQFRIVDQQLTRGVKDLMRDLPDDPEPGAPGPPALSPARSPPPDGPLPLSTRIPGANLVGALSTALCRAPSRPVLPALPHPPDLTSPARRADINRLSTTDAFASTAAARRAKPRIVVLSVTQDSSAQYVPIMNCIFTAQKNVRLSLLRLSTPCPQLTSSLAGRPSPAALRRTSRSTCARCLAPMPSFSSRHATSRAAPTTGSSAAPPCCSTSSCGPFPVPSSLLPRPSPPPLPSPLSPLLPALTPLPPPPHRWASSPARKRTRRSRSRAKTRSTSAPRASATAASSTSATSAPSASRVRCVCLSPLLCSALGFGPSRARVVRVRGLPAGQTDR